VYNARTHAPTSRISYICMNNAQETQNTNVLVHVVIFRVFHKTRTGIVCACRRSLGPTDSHERVSIFISLYYLLTFSPRNRFFFHGPLLHTPFIIQKKKKLCVCGYYFIHNIYAYICIWKGWGYKKPVFLEKKKTCHCHTSRERVT